MAKERTTFMISEYEKFKHELPFIFNSLEDYYMVTHLDNKGSITYTNKLFLENSKWTPKRVLGKTFWQMFPTSATGQKQAQTIWLTLMNGRSWSGTVEKMNRHEESYFVNMVALPIQREDIVISVILIELDMTEDIELRERLKEIAFIDYETGLMSRYNLETTIHDLIKKKDHFSFVYIVIDHFYTLKDLQSYESEKEIVKAFANRLKRFFQDNDIARVGINEFVVLTPFGDWYVEGFLEFLKLQPIYINNNALQLSVSGGIIRYPEDQRSYNHLMKAAIAATQEVVANGGGKIATLSAKSHKQINRKSIIDLKLNDAIENNELQVVYQPQIDIETGKTILYEAFVRWHDKDLGTVTPEELIPIAEENGFIHKIGAYVLEDAAKLIASWKAQGKDLIIAVNSSVREFGNKHFAQNMLLTLEKYNCPASHLEIEITEKFAFKAEEERSIISQMAKLKNEGVRFTLDDFGTGYASFRYMQSLPIHKIKIDQVFTQSLTTHHQTQKLVEGMIQFGKSMDFTVVAEGVETKEQHHILTSIGIDAVQGYHLGEPVTSENILL